MGNPMNINNLQRVQTSLDLRDRLLENYYTASLTEFKRVPGLLDSEAGLSSSLKDVLNNSVSRVLRD